MINYPPKALCNILTHLMKKGSFFQTLLKPFFLSKCFWLITGTSFNTNLGGLPVTQTPKKSMHLYRSNGPHDPVNFKGCRNFLGSLLGPHSMLFGVLFGWATSDPKKSMHLYRSNGPHDPKKH